MGNGDGGSRLNADIRTQGGLPSVDGAVAGDAGKGWGGTSEEGGGGGGGAAQVLASESAREVGDHAERAPP